MSFLYSTFCLDLQAGYLNWDDELLYLTFCLDPQAKPLSLILPSGRSSWKSFVHESNGIRLSSLDLLFSSSFLTFSDISCNVLFIFANPLSTGSTTWETVNFMSSAIYIVQEELWSVASQAYKKARAQRLSSSQFLHYRLPHHELIEESSTAFLFHHAELRSSWWIWYRL